MSVIILVYRLKNIRERSQMLSGSLLMLVQHHLTLFMVSRTLKMEATESWNVLPKSDGDKKLMRGFIKSMRIICLMLS